MSIVGLKVKVKPSYKLYKELNLQGKLGTIVNTLPPFYFKDGPYKISLTRGMIGVSFDSGPSFTNFQETDLILI